jgi:hypothetical protein
MSTSDSLPEPDANEAYTFNDADIQMSDFDRSPEPAAEAETVCVHSVLVEHGGPDSPGDPTHRPLAPNLLNQLLRQRPQPPAAD